MSCQYNSGKMQKILTKLLSVYEKPVHRLLSQYAFVPKYDPYNTVEVNKLQEFIDGTKNLFVLTGAGVSTESGIPDYRSEGVGLYATSSKRPVQFKVFMESASARQGYWARNYVGWPRFSSFHPNITHRVLADWEQRGKIKCLVTQNVDRLHHKAGSTKVYELHGTAFNVTCMSCAKMVTRHSFQNLIRKLNPHMSIQSDDIRPDGDVELAKEDVEKFVVPSCSQCGGIMKPYIVFFGDNVPAERLKNIREDLASSDGLLVLGSSLYVYSGYRFILQAVEAGIKCCAVNIGTTRADKHLQFRLSGRCGEILPKIIV